MRGVVRMLSLAAALAAAAWAVDFGGLKPSGYVNDFAGVVDPQSKAALEAYCARVEAATGAQIALVTIGSLEGEPIEDVANVIYRKWGVGNKKNNEGVLLLLAIQDRRSRLEVGYGLEPVMPDGYAGQVIREMRSALRRGAYGEALAEAAASIGETIAKAKGVQIGNNVRPRRVRRDTDNFPWEVLLIVGAVLLALLFFGGGRSGRPGGGGGIGGFLTGMLLGQLMGGGYRGRSGGGFGGYDSGDSFGGFGGGDSGGGGASSDW